MTTTAFKPRGVCAKNIRITTEDGVIQEVEFEGGCNGNLKAISKLVQGQPVDSIIKVLEGNTCGPRSTSCADQLAQALKEHL